MIVFVQPFGLYSTVGGARIMRSLLKDAPHPCISICVSPKAQPESMEIKEIHLAIRPYCGRIETTRLTKFLYMLELLFSNNFRNKLLSICREYKATAIHGIAHAMDFWYAYEVSREMKVPFYLSVHDDIKYNYKGKPGLNKALLRVSRVWKDAEECFVISQELGEEYCARYGRRSYKIITDGITNVPELPQVRPTKNMRVYFMGAIHFRCSENFNALLRALNRLKLLRPEYNISLTCRCIFTGTITKGIPINILPWASEEAVNEDMKYADMLYLPLPFSKKDVLFVKYSLSTKMVTYLGSGLPILYHGPENSGVDKILSKHRAAIAVYSLEPEKIINALLEAEAKSEMITENALKLGKDEFFIDNIRERFWRAFERV